VRFKVCCPQTVEGGLEFLRHICVLEAEPGGYITSQVSEHAIS
jgi:hypothetical protein